MSKQNEQMDKKACAAEVFKHCHRGKLAGIVAIGGGFAIALSATFGLAAASVVTLLHSGAMAYFVVKDQAMLKHIEANYNIR